MFKAGLLAYIAPMADAQAQSHVTCMVYMLPVPITPLLIPVLHGPLILASEAEDMIMLIYSEICKNSYYLSVESSLVFWAHKL